VISAAHSLLQSRHLAIDRHGHALRQTIANIPAHLFGVHSKPSADSTDDPSTASNCPQHEGELFQATTLGLLT